MGHWYLGHHWCHTQVKESETFRCIEDNHWSRKASSQFWTNDAPLDDFREFLKGWTNWSNRPIVVRHKGGESTCQKKRANFINVNGSPLLLASSSDTDTIFMNLAVWCSFSPYIRTAHGQTFQMDSNECFNFSLKYQLTIVSLCCLGSGRQDSFFSVPCLAARPYFSV